MVQVEVLLVRHGHAGSKERWQGDDRARPLSAKGYGQAEWLASVLIPLEPTAIVSSPYLRCLQTVEPTAAKLDLDISTSDQLVPDAGSGSVDYLERLGRSRRHQIVVVCTHGEIIGDALSTLADRADLRLKPKPPGQKGGLWTIELRAGVLRQAHYTPPG
jgi:8-oxo-(d)GTP phosphatase